MLYKFSVGIVVVLILAIFAGGKEDDKSLSFEERLSSIENIVKNKLDITPEINIALIIQNLSGVDDKGNYSTLSVELEKMFDFKEYVFAFLHFECGAGKGVDEYVPSSCSMNADAGKEEYFKIAEVRIGFRARDFPFLLQVGKIDLTSATGPEGSSFDESSIANDEKEQFLSAVFVNNPVVEWPDDNSLAICLWTWYKRLRLGAAWAAACAEWEHIEDGFGIVQAGVSWLSGDLEGSGCCYGYLNTKEHKEILSDDTKDGKGIGLNISQNLKYFSLFTRLGLSDSTVYEFDRFVSGGLEVPVDDLKIGIGVGELLVGDDYKKKILSETGVKPDNERYIESYIKYAFTEQFLCSLHFSQVILSEDSSVNDDVYLISLRFTCSL